MIFTCRNILFVLWTVAFTSVLALSACDTVEQSAKVSAEAVVVDKLIMSGHGVDTASSVDLTDEEKHVFRNSVGTYLAFKTKWLSYFNKDTMYIEVRDINFDDFLGDFDQLVSAYNNSRDVVKNNWDEYSPEDKLILKGYSKLAQAYNRDVRTLVTSGKEQKAIISALEFGKTMTGIISR